MSKSKLITTSLFGAINWYETCPSNWKEKALKDLNNTLKRIWTTPNPAAQRGIDFEKLLYATLRMGKEEDVICSDKFREIMKACKGGIFQKKIKKFIEIDEEEYCLFGKIDVDMPYEIIDIKTTGNYKGKSNYLKGTQHRLYCYITKKKKFEYIIVEFDGDSGPIQNVHNIFYEVENWKSVENELIEEIKKAMLFLKNKDNLLDLYLDKYCLY